MALDPLAVAHPGAGMSDIVGEVRIQLDDADLVDIARALGIEVDIDDDEDPQEDQ